MTMQRTLFLISVLLLLLPLTLFAEDQEKHQAIVDSLKKIPAEAPQNPDPSSYQDEASAGMFKALKPVPSADEPLDDTRDLAQGWRILLGIEKTEAGTKTRQSIAKKSLSLPVSIRHSSIGYEILAGNFTNRDDANNAINECKRRGFPNAKIVTSRVLLETQSPAPIHAKPKIDSQAGKFWQVQITTADSRESAETVQKELESVTNRVIDILPTENNHWRVRVGRFEQKRDAARFRDSLRANGYPDSWMTVPEQQ